MSANISIIIPCKEIDAYTEECVSHCKELDYDLFEIILLPDHTITDIEGVRVIQTGSITPGAKRNIGLSNTAGEFCAFIDSDAYPNRKWLSNALSYFEDPEIAAVGGPGLTPEGDSFMQKASGLVLSSFMVGNLSTRYKSKNLLESDDIHSCNFIARKSILVSVGGWNEKYWPGEDTLMCRAIKSLGKKMIEAPDVVVYHHRRPLFRQHLRQISNFGVHRGFFMKKYRANSAKLKYFFPSFFVLFFITGGLLSTIYQSISPILFILLASYATSCFIVSLLSTSSFKMTIVVWLGIILTHIYYGVAFMIGLLKSDLTR